MAAVMPCCDAPLREEERDGKGAPAPAVTFARWRRRHHTRRFGRRSPQGTFAGGLVILGRLGSLFAPAGFQRSSLLTDCCQAGIVGRRLGSGRLLFQSLCRLAGCCCLGKLVTMLRLSLLLIGSLLGGSQLLLRLQQALRPRARRLLCGELMPGIVGGALNLLR